MMPSSKTGKGPADLHQVLCFLRTPQCYWWCAAPPGLSFGSCCCTWQMQMEYTGKLNHIICGKHACAMLSKMVQRSDYLSQTHAKIW